MLETVVLEVLTKVTNIERTQQNVVIGERSTARFGQTRRFEQSGVVVEITPQAVFQDKLFLGYKVLLQTKPKSWIAVVQGSFQAHTSGTTQLLVGDKRFGNFIDLSVKTFAENTNEQKQRGSQGNSNPLFPNQRKKNPLRQNAAPPA